MVIKKGPIKQASRAASMVVLIMEWRQKLESESAEPVRIFRYRVLAFVV